MGIGALIQAPFSGDSTVALVGTLVGLLTFGFGVSFALPALVAGMANGVPMEFAGIGAGALNSARQVGASLGVAVLGMVLHPGPEPGRRHHAGACRRRPRPVARAVITVTGLRGRPATS